MIFVVDDDPIYLELLGAMLEEEGYPVKVFDAAGPALDALQEALPEAIVSDIRMPGIDGFQFKEKVDSLFPDQGPPFIFLSSLDQPAHLIRGLDLGAVDYLTKPIDSGVLRAKLRSLLKRNRRRSANTTFQGDLSCFPFIKVIQFCESEGFTGSVKFEGEKVNLVLPFRAGHPVMEELGKDEDILADLYDLEEGVFTIVPGTLDFSRISGIEIREESPVRNDPEKSEQVMGKLSGMKLLGRLFQVQSEYNLVPEPRILTVVMVDGSLVHQKEMAVEAVWSREAIVEYLQAQHLEVEDEIRKKAEALVKKKTDSGDQAQVFYTLFEKGIEAFQKMEYKAALGFWEEAEKIKPNDPMLQVNLRIVRAKI